MSITDQFGTVHNYKLPYLQTVPGRLKGDAEETLFRKREAFDDAPIVKRAPIQKLTFFKR